MNSNIRNFLLSSLLVVFLAGCGSAAGQAPAAASSQAAGASDLTLTMKTGLGILELEDDTLAVSAEQAAEMLPLWQALQTLSTDSNTTPDEITAINDQIKETLSSSQLAAIDKMSWSDQELSTLLRSVNASSNQTSSDQTHTTNTGANARPSGDGMPAGGPPDGGGMMLAGAAGTGNQVATSHAELPGQADRITAGGMNLTVAPAVIQLLQSKLTSA